VKLNTHPPPRGNIKNSYFHTITLICPSYSKTQLTNGLSLRVGLLTEQRTPDKRRRKQRSDVFSDVAPCNVVARYQLYQGTVCCPRWREQIAAKRPDYTATHSRRYCSLADRSGNIAVSDSEVNLLEARWREGERWLEVAQDRAKVAFQVSAVFSIRCLLQKVISFESQHGACGGIALQAGRSWCQWNCSLT